MSRTIYCSPDSYEPDARPCDYCYALHRNGGDACDEPDCQVASRAWAEPIAATCCLCGGCGGGPDPALHCLACDGSGECSDGCQVRDTIPIPPPEMKGVA